MSAFPVSTNHVRNTGSSRVAVARVRPINLAAVAGFVVCTGVAYLVSSLSGNILLEKARQEGRAANRIERSSAVQIRVLESELDRATALASISAWGDSHGFVTPLRQATTSTSETIVAVNH